MSAGGSFSKSLKTWCTLPIRFSPSWPCHGWDLLCRLPAGTCAIIKVECCVYTPDLPGNVSTALDDMKNQVKAMSNEYIPFWTSVLSWVKGNWWKTIFTTVIVSLIVFLCAPWILQCLVNFETQRLIAFSNVGGRRATVQYIAINDAHYGNQEHQKGGMKKEFIGPGLHLRPVHADHARPPLQWTLNYV